MKRKINQGKERLKGELKEIPIKERIKGKGRLEKITSEHLTQEIKKKGKEKSRR